MQWWGVAGIALSTSCVYIFSFVFLLFFALRNLREVDNLGLTNEQKQRVAALQQSKFDEIETLLSVEQKQTLQKIELQRPRRYQRGNGVNLTADQKAEIATIRQENVQKLRAY
jgi:hypothetical protein